MSTLPTYLWKEWRDHRSPIVAYLIATPIVAAIGLGLIPARWFESRFAVTSLTQHALFIGFGVAALAFGSDLVSGEMRRSKLGFLARMPADLGGAFRAKLLFFLAALAVFTGWTYLSAAIVGGLRKPDTWFPLLPWTSQGKNLAIVLVGASWLFAVSCWMPRGTFAIPATVLALVAWLAPVFAVFAFNQPMELRDGELGTITTWLALAGLGVAALSFLRGWRHGGTVCSRMTWSLGSACLAFAPVWSWAGVRLHEFRHLDPSEANFGIYATALGAGGRFAFVTGYHTLLDRTNERDEYGATHPMIVDVTTGEWREVGDPGDLFWFLGHRWERANADAVLIVADKHDPAIPMASQFEEGFDGATGLPLTNEQWKPFLHGAQGAQRVWNRETDFTLLPDGSRAWAAGPRILVESKDGTRRELPCQDETSWRRPLGAGFDGEYFWFDCTRERAWRKLDVKGDVKLIRARSWIVWRTDPQSECGLSLWNPDTRERAPIQGWQDGEVLALHPDGRVVVVERVVKPGDPRSSTVRDTGALVLLDPESGARHELPLPNELASTISCGWSYGFTASSDLLIALLEVDPIRGFQHAWIVRLDPRTDEVVCLGPFGQLANDVLGSPDRDTVVFVEDSRRLVRAHFDGRPAETLFPRSR